MLTFFSLLWLFPGYLALLLGWGSILRASFKNDIEPLEKLFEPYTKIVSQPTSSKKPSQRKA